MKLGQLLRESKGQEWIVPRYLRYLRKRTPAAEAEHAAQILSRPERDRSIGWSASAAGSCLRAQLYQARGVKKESETSKGLNIFFNGEYMHLRHQVSGLVAGYLSDVEIPVQVTELNVFGTMDAQCVDGPVAEYKSINPYGYSSVNQFGPKREHLHQVHAYMWAKGVEQARIVYENKGTNELTEFAVNFDPDIHNANIADWKELNDRHEDGTLPPMLPECQAQEGRFKWCPFAEVCLADHQRPRLRIRRKSSSDEG